MALVSTLCAKVPRGSLVNSQDHQGLFKISEEQRAILDIFWTQHYLLAGSSFAQHWIILYCFCWSSIFPKLGFGFYEKGIPCENQCGTGDEAVTVWFESLRSCAMPNKHIHITTKYSGSSNLHVLFFKCLLG